MSWTHRDRVEAVLHGEVADRPPVSAWHHFPESEGSAAGLAAATVDEATRFGWDWVKINPRATLFAEIWDAVYDSSDYFGGDVPRLVHAPLQRLADLAGLDARPESAVIAEQAEAVRAIRVGLGDEVPLYFTVFSPLTTVLELLGLPFLHSPVYGRGADFGLADLWASDPEALHAALDAAATTLEALTAAVLATGADGVFYAVTGTAGPRIVGDRERFDDFSTPYDRRVLDAAGGRAVLHTCGAHAHPDWFVDWPVQALSWDPSAPGNPGLGELGSDRVVPVGGVDRTLLDGRHGAAVAEQVAHARSSLAGRPFLLAPSCSIPAGIVSGDGLRVLADSVA